MNGEKAWMAGVCIVGWDSGKASVLVYTVHMLRFALLVGV